MENEYLLVESRLPDKTEYKLACAACSLPTYHEVLAGVREEGSTEDANFSSEYWIVLCKGCRAVSFCHRTSTSDDWEFDDEGNEVPRVRQNLYPSRMTGGKKPNWVFELPHLIYTIYEETRSALANDQRILAGIGMRTIVETVCTQNGLTNGNLQSKIDQLRTAGAVTIDGAKILHSLRFMGNAAAHEGKGHKQSELVTAFEVIENILFNVLILPLRANKLPS